MLNLFDKLRVLNVLPSVLKLPEVIKSLKWTATFDGRPARVEAFRFVMGTTAKVDVRFKLEQTHTIIGTFPLRGSGADVIRYDGRDVENDDVDPDVIGKIFPPTITLQFEFRFTDKGVPHEFRVKTSKGIPLGRFAPFLGGG